jgi:hypothetical protein
MIRFLITDYKLKLSVKLRNTILFVMLLSQVMDKNGEVVSVTCRVKVGKNYLN